MNTQFITTPDGLKISYDVAGDGPALVLLHGAGQTRRDWHTTGYVAHLRQNYRVITLDIRGSGESQRCYSEAEYAIELICADVQAVATACGVSSFAVWGYSFGGNIARYLGAWLPAVQAVGLVGVPFGPAVDDTIEEYIAILEQKWGALLAGYQAGSLDSKSQRKLLKSDTAVWLPCFKAMRAWPAPEPDSLRCPAMLAAGTHNQRVLQWVKANRDALDAAGVELILLDGLTHQQEFTATAQVLPVIDAFLETNVINHG